VLAAAVDKPSHSSGTIVQSVMQDPRLVALLVVLVGAIVTGACLGGMAPRSHAQWRWIGMTVGFLIWLLAGMFVVRASEEGSMSAGACAASFSGSARRNAARQIVSARRE
jgi:F0F1-type ATP synthase assembly protein I